MSAETTKGHIITFNYLILTLPSWEAAILILRPEVLTNDYGKWHETKHIIISLLPSMSVIWAQTLLPSIYLIVKQAISIWKTSNAAPLLVL